jgi:uncharacterized repeat protein (TIGR03803 family)
MKALTVAKAVCLLASFCLLLVTAARSQTFQTLATFNGGNGSNPTGALVQGSDGNFYGTTLNGGTVGLGTIFKMTPEGTLTTFYNFCDGQTESSCDEAFGPLSGLVVGNDGQFYGTTGYTDHGGWTSFGGSVFTITASGAFTTLYDFCAIAGCPREPGALVQGTDGNFYGTTPIGPYDGGTFFSVTPEGQHTTIYKFATLGSDPTSDPLVLGSDGNFYGTTYGGGQSGAGMVYKITPAGVLTELFSFCKGCANGSYPSAGLVLGNDGNFYGSTSAGGLHNGGTLFRISPSGNLTTLYNFCSVMSKEFCADGMAPATRLIQGTDGNFYGVTAEGGTGQGESGCLDLSGKTRDGCGTIFSLTPSGVLTTLHDFCSVAACADGTNPNALVQASDGTFYGSAYTGASANDGVVFSLSLDVALAPTFAPATLGFGNQAVDTSATKAVTIKNVNTGMATLDLTSFTVTGSTEFAISGNKCGATVAPGKSCVVSITYTPSALGAEAATLSIADNGPNSPQKVPLSGTGVVQAALTASSVIFPKTKVGTTSAAKNVTLKNNLPTALTGISYATAAPFAISTSTCGTTLNGKASCTISVTFSPTATGTVKGTLTVRDSANNSPQTSGLSGTGD